MTFLANLSSFEKFLESFSDHICFKKVCATFEQKFSQFIFYRLKWKYHLYRMSSSSVLALIVDSTACAWGELIKSKPDALHKALETISAICNIFSAFDATNELLAYTACKKEPVKLIYPSDAATCSDPGRAIVDAVKCSLKEQASAGSDERLCPLSGALATALCSFNRRS